jgi:hypothetical protein
MDVIMDVLSIKELLLTLLQARLLVASMAGSYKIQLVGTEQLKI